MFKLAKKDYYILLIVGLILCWLGVSLFTESKTLLTTVVIFTTACIGIFTALFFPLLFCYGIVFLAPLSINFSQITGGLALSLPAEGMLGLIVLLSLIKVFAGLKINKAILFHPITIILALDILWMIATTFFSTMPEVSAKRAILKTSFIVGFFFIFTHLFSETKKPSVLFMLYGAGIIFPIINALITHASFGFAQEESFEMTEPFYEDHTLYGACIAFIIPFFTLFMIKKWKETVFSFQALGASLFLIFIVVAELLSYSRAAWLSIIAAFGIYFISLLKIPAKYYLITSFIIVVIASLQFDSIYQNIQSGEAKKNNDNVEQHLQTVTDLKSNASNLERINRWVCAYRMFEQKPFTGWGAGTYQFQYAQFQSNEFKTQISSNNGDRGNSHSEYLTLLSEQGLIGLLLFIALIAVAFSKGITLINSAKNKINSLALYGAFLGLITFFAHGLFNAFSDYEKMSILVYGSLAIIVCIDVNQTKLTDNKE